MIFFLEEQLLVWVSFFENKHLTLNFESIYDGNKNMVYNLSLNYLQNIEDAQEVTQDVFVSVYNSIKDFKDQATMSTWIYRITINKCLDCIKSKKRKKRFVFLTSLFFPESGALQHDVPEFNHPGVLLEDKESIEYIFKSINSLPENQKTALILYKLEHRSQLEIAEIMSISPKAVESLVQRAKTNLSNKLKSKE